MRALGDLTERIYNRFVVDLCQRSSDFLDSRGGRHAPKIRISAYGSIITDFDSTDYGGGCTHSSHCAPPSCHCDVFGHGVKVSFPRLATDTRATGDARRQTRVTWNMEMNKARCRRKEKCKSKGLIAVTALLVTTRSDPSEVENTDANFERGRQDSD